MKIYDKIEEELTKFWNINGFEPSSIELTASQAEELKGGLVGVGLEAFEKYVPEGDEIGLYGGIKVYIARLNEVSLKPRPKKLVGKLVMGISSEKVISMTKGFTDILGKYDLSSEDVEKLLSLTKDALVTEFLPMHSSSH